MCTGNIFQYCVAQTKWCGLSLCIQGTQYKNSGAWIFGRFIPVYTGNTSIILKISHRCPVYPCVYREHVILTIIIAGNIGLSLCIQGTPSYAWIWEGAYRFIPVYTGNTPLRIPALAAPTVYPCVYREHLISIFKLTTDHGLSLCIQGTQYLYLT